MAVQSMPSATSINRQGYGAQGIPMCTPSGEKVYCLPDHDYHRCSSGKVPCCADGSQPLHSERGSAASSTNAVICGSGEMGSNREEQRDAEHMEEPPQVILDDMDSSVVTEMTNAHEGSYQPCMVDAYGGQFHHDWARNKGSAMFSFAFDPPRSGCYRIEEHHPGSDWRCARYLPRNARVEVETGMNGSSMFQINQAERAAQWNEVGWLHFYEDVPSKLTMRNSFDEQCAENCFWVVDAFRLTWMAARCPENLDHQNSLQTQVQESPAADADEPPQEHESVLTLRARFGEEAVGDLELTLIEHQGTVQEALRAHFGTQSLTVTAIVAIDKRRRLQTSVGSGQSFAVHLSSKGVAGTVLDDDGGHLAHSLQAALTRAGADIVVESAVVRWGVLPSTGDGADADVDAEWSATVYIISAGVVMVLLTALVWALCRRMRLQRARTIEAMTTEKSPPGDEENPAWKSNDSSGSKGMEEKASNSTQPPSEGASDGNSSEEGIESKSDAADAPVPPEACSAKNSKM